MASSVLVLSEAKAGSYTRRTENLIAQSPAEGCLACPDSTIEVFAQSVNEWKR